MIRLFFNILIIAALIAGSIGLFFLWLPYTTKHGETLTVPDMRGYGLLELEHMLSHGDLQLAVADSGFSPDQPPLTVLSHRPSPQTQVKVGRTIYLTVNAHQPPSVEVPDIFQVSLKNASQLLKSYGLRVGEVKYLPHHQSGRILKVWVDSLLLTPAMIAEGYGVPKNTRIHLGVGDGIGDITVRIPKLVGRPIDEAELYLLGIDLHVGQLHWLPQADAPWGTVVRQRPYYGATARKGQGIDLWVAGSP